MIHVRQWRRASIAAALVGLTSSLVLYANRHYAGDVYWLLAAGRELWQDGLTDVDPFPTLSEGRVWNNQQWLAELFFYGLERLGGMRAVSLAHSLVVALSLLPLLLGSRNRRLPEVLGAWVLLLPLLVALLDPRAAGFSLLCFSLLIVLVDGELRRWRVWLIPPLFVFWANVHGAFLVGLLLFALVLAGGALDARLGRRAESFSARFLALGVALPAILLTPITTGIFDYLEALSGNPILPRLTFEWDPTWEHPVLLLYVVAIAAFGVHLLRLHPSPRPLEPALVTAGFCILAVTATRHLVWLGPIAFYLLRRAGRPGRIAVSRRWSLPALGASLALIGLWLAVVGPPPNERKLSTALAEHVAAHPRAGRVAAAPGTGSYLLWRAPGQAVTVDGRFENYTVDELDGTYDVLAGERLELLERWAVDGLITRQSRGLPALRRAGFRVVRRAEGAFYLVRSAPVVRSTPSRSRQLPSSALSAAARSRGVSASLARSSRRRRECAACSWSSSAWRAKYETPGESGSNP